MKTCQVTTRLMMPNLKGSHIFAVGIVLFVAIFVQVDGASATSSVGRLVDDLFKDYVIARPKILRGDPVIVNMSFCITQIRDLDGRYQMLATSGFLIMKWEDKSLSWDPAQYEGVGFFETDASNVWTPRIGLRNSASHVVSKDWTEAFAVYVYADGTLVWLFADYFESTCNLNMLMFPFDTQTCSLNFGNVFHDNTLVDLFGDPDHINTDFYFPSKEFDLQSTYVVRETSTLSLTGGTEIPEIQFTLVLSRKPDYYVLNIIVPTVVLAFLSACTFCVPEESGEKLSLGITLLLSFSVFLLILSENTPQTSGPLPLVSVYLSIIICMSGMSLFIQMLVMNIYHIDPVPAIPPCLKRLMRCSRVLRTRPKKASVGCITQYTNPQEEMTEADSNANSTNKPTMHVDNRAVVQELKKITSHQRRRETDKALRAEWHLAANILDRICFFVFLGIHVILLLVALTLLPISEHISDSK